MSWRLNKRPSAFENEIKICTHELVAQRRERKNAFNERESAKSELFYAPRGPNTAHIKGTRARMDVQSIHKMILGRIVVVALPMKGFKRQRAGNSCARHSRLLLLMIKSFLEHFSSFCVNESLMMKVKGKSAPRRGKKEPGQSHGNTFGASCMCTCIVGANWLIKRLNKKYSHTSPVLIFHKIWNLMNTQM